MIKLFFRKRTTDLLVLLFCCLISGKVFSAGSTLPSDFMLTCSNMTLPFDVGGFSDWWYWGYSSLHPHNSHEMLSGEWAAAVYYDGIDDEDPNKAMWLTDAFSFPTWYTGSNFSKKGDPETSYGAWDDPNNPCVGNDTAKSIIADDNVKVTIDYEIVDLGESSNGSPITYYDEDTIKLVRSDRYVLLQTYTITNIDPGEETIENLEFYQMVHGHPANQYGTVVNSTYLTNSYTDPLENYTPYNSVHDVGNFRYDVTQWNTTPISHRDWLSFSCIVEPDVIDNDTYVRSGHNDGKPSVGTHINIEKRELNGEVSIYDEEASGAMGWYLDSLAPNESVSVTIAVMFGYHIPVDALYVTKTDDIDPNTCGVDPSSSDPNDYKIVYTIGYGNDITDANDPDYIGDATSVVLTDNLPDDIDPFNVTVTGGGVYDMFANPRTVTWNIGILEPGDSDSVTVTIYVEDTAEPTGELENIVMLTSDQGWARDTEYTSVCCFGGSIIYVDAYATGSDNGMSWASAYTDLQDALARAANDCGSEIWVAKGIYSPGDSTTDTFTIPDDVKVYGGFAGNETSKDDRDYVANKTYLSGYSGTVRNNKIVTMGDKTILDGFIVKEGKRGIEGDDDDFTVLNCMILNNNTYEGIRATNGNITVKWCVIKENEREGIYHSGSGKTLTVNNCKIGGNTWNGIYTSYSIATILNSLIYTNGSGGSGYYGIKLHQPSDNPEIRNSTIVYNTNEGINYTGSNAPIIRNDILWRNDSEDGFIQLGNCSATYSCITDPNDPNGVASGADVPDDDNNISCDPNFAYDYAQFGYYHLDSGSACVDKGDPCDSCTGEKDIDNANRIYNVIVDMGADEVDCNDTCNDMDFSADGLVNLVEFGIFAMAWLSQDPNGPGFSGDPNDSADWDSRCDLVSDYEIDLEDYVVFLDSWLWEACWRDSSEGIWMMMAGGYFSKMVASQPQSLSLFGTELLSLERQQKASLAAKSAPVPKLTLAEQAEKLSDNIDFLEEIWETDKAVQEHIDKEVWSDFMDSVYECLKYLEDQP